MRQTVGRAGQQLLYGGSAFQRCKHRQQSVERECGGRLRLVVQGEEMFAAELLQCAIELSGASRQLCLGLLQLYPLGRELELCRVEIRVGARQRRLEAAVGSLGLEQARVGVLHGENRAARQTRPESSADRIRSHSGQRMTYPRRGSVEVKDTWVRSTRSTRRLVISAAHSGQVTGASSV